MTVTIKMMVDRWSDSNTRPLFKGNLIDADGCCCAQGDVLRVCGWSDDRLRSTNQAEADREVAKSLGISVTHAVLLRQINDKSDGCPQDVLAHPERILGDQAPRVLAFWLLLDGFTPERWATAGVAAAVATRAAAMDAAGDAGRAAAAVATRAAASDAAVVASAVAVRAAAWDTAKTAGWTAAGATNEIQGAERLTKFHFLPILGINDPAELEP